MYKHKIAGPFPNDLIRDVDVTAFGVMGFGDHGVARSAASLSPMVAVLRKSAAQGQFVNRAFLIQATPVSPQRRLLALMRSSGTSAFAPLVGVERTLRWWC